MCEPDQVTCHSGYEYAERPVSLYRDGSWLKIAEILGRWRTPAGRHFRVVTENDQVFLVTFDEIQDCWHIEGPLEG
jgi:hypothetical protein